MPRHKFKLSNLEVLTFALAGVKDIIEKNLHGKSAWEVEDYNWHMLAEREIARRIKIIGAWQEQQESHKK